MPRNPFRSFSLKRRQPDVAQPDDTLTRDVSAIGPALPLGQANSIRPLVPHNPYRSATTQSPGGHQGRDTSHPPVSTTVQTVTPTPAPAIPEAPRVTSSLLDQRVEDEPHLNRLNAATKLVPSPIAEIQPNISSPKQSVLAEANSGLPSGWEASTTADGRVYYVDHATRTTTWIRPSLTTPEISSVANARAAENHVASPVVPTTATANALPHVSNPWEKHLPELESRLSILNLWAEPSLYKIRYERRLVGRRIRLLKINPGSGDEHVSCTLTESVFPPSEPFHALSYNWGDPGGEIPILCNGQTLSIRRNLYSIFWQLRQEGKQQLYWTDAICINQSDNVEKSSQVQMMKDIYTAASHVLIWLGTEEATDRQGVELMKRVYDTLGPPDLPIRQGSRSEHLVDLSLPSWIDPVWSPVAQIFRARWFRRIWILQEFIVSRSHEFRRGALVISSELMWAFTLNMTVYEQFGLVALHHQLDYPPWPWLYRVDYDPAIGSAGWSMSLMQLMAMSSPIYEATNILDKTFALVGLAKDGDPSIIDYSKDHKDVLIDISLRKFGLQGKLRGRGELSGIMPLWLIARTDCLYGLPSWVHDYQTIPKFHAFPLIFAQSRFLLGENLTPSINIDFPVVHITARLFDEVSLVLPDQPWKKLPDSKVTDSAAKQGALLMLGREPFHSYIVGMTEWIRQCLGLAQSIGQYPEEADGSMTKIEETMTGGKTSRSATALLWRILTCDKDKADGQRLPKRLSFSFVAFTMWHELAISLYVDSTYIEGTLPTLMATKPHEFKAPDRWGPLRTTLSPPLPDLPAIPGLITANHAANPREATLDPRLRLDNCAPGAANEPLGDRLNRLNRLMTPFDSLFGQWCHGRKFFSTKNGYLGWVPESAMAGDQLCVFHGSRMIFVIRAVLDRKKKNQFRVIGAAYVHGLMYGGAVAMGKGVDRTITLV